MNIATTKAKLKQLHDTVLHQNLFTLVKEEKKITAQVIEHIAEAERRKLFLKHSCTSLFQYLTQMGYAPASAQRRIDAARLLNQNLAISADLESGELNLSQIAILAQALRRKGNIPYGQKQQILAAIKGKDLKQSEIRIHQALDLQPVAFDKKSFQRDESVRVELTLSKEQWLLLEKVKQVLSHVDPNPNLATVFTRLANEFLKHRDPARKVKMKTSRSTSDWKSQWVMAQGALQLGAVGTAEKRGLFQEQQSCQWRDGEKVCGSKFQLQVDHIRSRRLGGGNDRANLQLLCGVHNRQKFALEVGL